MLYKHQLRWTGVNTQWEMTVLLSHLEVQINVPSRVIQTEQHTSLTKNTSQQKEEHYLVSLIIATLTHFHSTGC